jgi:cyanate permease
VVGWRAVFLIFGIFGFAWAAVWHWWFRDEPRGHPSVNAAELAVIVDGRQAASKHAATWKYWRRLFAHRNTLPLCVMYFPNSYAFYFCITWLPTYLTEKHGFTATLLGIFSGMPLVLSVLGDLFGGIATDRFSLRFGLRAGRAGVGSAAYAVAGTAMLLAAAVSEPVTAAVLIGIATAASMFTLGAAWGTCLDIGGNHAGVVSAAMNTSGQIGSILSPLIVVYLLERYGNWNLPLYVMGALFFVGAVAWAFIDPREPVFD